MAEVEPLSDSLPLKLQAVEALAPYPLRTTWTTGEVLDWVQMANEREARVSWLEQSPPCLRRKLAPTGAFFMAV